MKRFLLGVLYFFIYQASAYVNALGKVADEVDASGRRFAPLSCEINLKDIEARYKKADRVSVVWNDLVVNPVAIFKPKTFKSGDGDVNERAINKAVGAQGLNFVLLFPSARGAADTAYINEWVAKSMSAVHPNDEFISIDVFGIKDAAEVPPWADILFWRQYYKNNLTALPVLYGLREAKTVRSDLVFYDPVEGGGGIRGLPKFACQESSVSRLNRNGICVGSVKRGTQLFVTYRLPGSKLPCWREIEKVVEFVINVNLEKI